MEAKKAKTHDEKIALASTLKNEGNAFFQKAEYKKALDKYHRANLYLKGFNVGGDGKANNSFTQMASAGSVKLSDQQTQEIKTLSVAVFLNMAACHLKVNNAERALDDCNNAINLEPNNVKALFRRGQAYLLQRDTDRAREDLEKALKLSPTDKAIQQELRKLKDMEKQQLAKQKKAFAGIFDRASAEEQQQEQVEEKKEVNGEHQAEEKKETTEQATKVEKTEGN